MKAGGDVIGSAPLISSYRKRAFFAGIAPTVACVAARHRFPLASVCSCFGIVVSARCCCYSDVNGVGDPIACCGHSNKRQTKRQAMPPMPRSRQEDMKV
ncbi:hypothetical protein BHE74_00013982 [Ensete ventricosum]|nr:hypothetical protein GW17_00018777 [Ensete ventricosum]RWW77839.1 hypothetical protein BHE74_00013982 [Ensete ventricosum]RZR85517.1 hypothetical protein BHM03_00012521 [Ensete ventricosum]